jgi:membrane dipeptidase
VRTWLAFEGAAPLAGDPDAVSRWSARGVRIFGLVHTSDNALATSSAGSRVPAHGLTDAGRELVRRVHASGGVVDVSHASDPATDEVIRMALADGVPAVATHSNARALAPHPRNLTDDQIRGIARTGGVVGINFHSRFLVAEGRAEIADVVRHVRHVARVAGTDHVALGSDFEGDIHPPRGLQDVAALPRLARALEADGLPRADVEKIFSRNALRVLCPRAPAPKN